nr:Machado-Joseph disease protein MJD domain containing protein [Haemonchus contortus]
MMLRKPGESKSAADDTQTVTGAINYSKVHIVTMYHERQSRQMCLVHALNALFQKPHFTSESLDEICYSLNESRWFNPHRSMLGLGNYDANVLMSALAMYDYQDNNRYFNLDSKLDKPEEITDIVGYCRSLLSKTADSNQIFLVGKGDSSLFVSAE